MKTYTGLKVAILAGVAFAMVLVLLAPRLIHVPATTASVAATATPTPQIERHQQRAATAGPVLVRQPRQPVPAVLAPTARPNAWVTLASYTAAPGDVAIGVSGGGFAPGEQVDLRVAGTEAHSIAVLRADNTGAVDGTVQLHLASTSSTVQLQAVGQRSGASATATMRVVSSSALINLVPYAARPGQAVDVQGQGFASGEAVRLLAGSTLIARTHTGSDGSLQWRAAYRVPFAARQGFLGLAVVGEQSQRAAQQRLSIVPLRPWATASAYVVHPGDHVQFDLQGFAAGEVVNVYADGTYFGHSAGPTDADGHVAGVGPFAVPAGSQSPTYTFIGARSGARLRVTLTVPQK